MVNQTLESGFRTDTAKGQRLAEQWIQSNLFFFAYRFDIIPIDLISSIYEKFYSINPKKKRDEGSYYTPSALVDFVLAQTLTEDVLATKPRVLDPACGSGISRSTASNFPPTFGTTIARIFAI